MLARARTNRRRLNAPVALLAACLSACASTAAVVRPSPFPGASVPRVEADVPARLPALVSDDIVRTALAYRGVPYRLGGDSPDSGFDCSGFVRYVFAAHPLDLPRTVGEQYALGAHVDVDDVRAGDLLYFSTVASGASHVGIALDNVQFVHAPAASGVVRVERLDTSYWHDRYVGARRLF
jgi:cell wall-associated NlpC family hydrolase